MDKIGQILLTKACKKVTGPLEKGEEQYGADGETESQGLETAAPGLMGTEQLSTELDSKTPTPPAPTLLKVTSSPVGPGSASAGPSLLGSTLPTNVRSIVTTLVPSELISAAPTTKSNHVGITSEPLAGGLVEEKVGSHPELLSSIGMYSGHGIISCEFLDDLSHKRKHDFFSTWRKKNGLNGNSDSSIYLKYIGKIFF